MSVSESANLFAQVDFNDYFSVAQLLSYLQDDFTKVVSSLAMRSSWTQTP